MHSMYDVSDGFVVRAGAIGLVFGCCTSTDGVTGKDRVAILVICAFPKNIEPIHYHIYIV